VIVLSFVTIGAVEMGLLSLNAALFRTGPMIYLALFVFLGVVPIVRISLRRGTMVRDETGTYLLVLNKDIWVIATAWVAPVFLMWALGSWGAVVSSVEMTVLATLFLLTFMEDKEITYW
jgi:hypothetical protein